MSLYEIHLLNEMKREVRRRKHDSPAFSKKITQKEVRFYGKYTGPDAWQLLYIFGLIYLIPISISMYWFVPWIISIIGGYRFLAISIMTGFGLGWVILPMIVLAVISEEITRFVIQGYYKSKNGIKINLWRVSGVRLYYEHMEMIEKNPWLRNWVPPNDN